MHIVFVDDSLPFDGHIPASQPPGGAEKAFASLPGALAPRGHHVQVFNRCSDRLSGAVADAEEAFARAALSLLEDDQAYLYQSEAARSCAHGRTWDAAAAAFEANWR